MHVRRRILCRFGGGRTLAFLCLTDISERSRIRPLMRSKLLVLLCFISLAAAARSGPETAEADYVKRFKPAKAPRPNHLLLQSGDRLAICGDSITEQKMYS